ncbi:hypothetical protein MKW94_017134 [Papaver nudicaule]|uniref:Wax synthase domain-containing protein n=1 Tax=Papaver nudicaule TaxID=74823 RepID=A0AA41V6P1_PAPNU|nr:hypothetical protein [Papaver nudicaule]
MEEGDELWRFIRLLIVVVISLTYCYFISKNIPKGFLRFFSVFPIILIFTYLPLSVSSMHLSGSTGFFLGWLANFKLLLFACGKGPLSCTTSDSGSSISLKRFISVACFPIKIKNNIQKPSHNDHDIQISKPKSHLYYATQALLLAILVRVYVYKENLPRSFILFLYTFHMYFSLEILLAMSASLARFILGLELEPQFYDPYLSTSLQDFWGRRWNLMVTGILRPTVYEPVRLICTNIFGRNLSLAMAVLATFVVSGLMHELMFFYMCRVLPTWEVLCFFILHGICLITETRVKKLLNDKFQLPRLVSRTLTIGFVAVTCFWLFIPILGRCKIEIRGNEELVAFAEFAKAVIQNSLVYLQLQTRA